MDHQKTGTLIATRRNELGLTQKELAKQLNISDRTISKWERGAGFPDISLLEPLADALGLTLLELFRGERTPEPEPEPEKEEVVREALQALRPAILARLKKVRFPLIVLSILLLAAVAALLILIFRPEENHIIIPEPITVTRAVELRPDILITTKEYELRDLLLNDAAITALLSDDAILTLDDALTAPYKDIITVSGNLPDIFEIGIIYHNINVDYSFGESRTILSFIYDGFITKTCSQTRDSTYAVENRNNETFSLYDFS